MTQEQIDLRRSELGQIMRSSNQSNNLNNPNNRTVPTMNLILHPEVDPFWSRLTNEQRSEVSIWCEIIAQYDRAENKGAALYVLNKRFAPSLGYEITKPTLCRKIKNIRDGIVNGVCEGVLGSVAVRMAMGARRSSKMPPAFLSYVRDEAVRNQRRKFQTVWREIIERRLRAGAIIPGYGKDWRGIFADQHPGEPIPPYCPYNAVIRGWAACQPDGWSYSNLKKYAPERDVWAGAAVGVHAMRKFNMSMPKTRVGLRPMTVITMDDVDPDLLCHYRGEREARRPTGLGVLDIATGCMIDYTLVPKQKDPVTGKCTGLKGFWIRYKLANVFCAIGIDEQAGLTAMMEHGTAGVDDDEVGRINRILGSMPDGQPWFRVQRSSTSGAPIMKGLFSERGRGLPNFKACIESFWNALHNRTAVLPGQVGKDWATSPQDTDGWQREDRDLISVANALAESKDAVEQLKFAQTHALSYDQLNAYYQEAISALNNRQGHAINDFEKCGFVKHMVEVAGALVPLDDAAKDLAGGDPVVAEQMLKTLAPRQRVVVMSPQEAWNSFPKKLRKVFSPFVATQILGDDLSQVVTVKRGEFVAVNHWSEEPLAYSAVVRDEHNVPTVFQEGEQLRVWVNPINVNFALVSRPSGEFLGIAKYLAPSVWGDVDGMAGNLGELAISRAEQRQRLEHALAGRVKRESERRVRNCAAIAAAGAAFGGEAGRAAQSQLEEMAGETFGEIEEL